MEFDDVVRSRRSIRAFSPRDVSDEVVRELVGSAVLAPSSMNGQPWSFVAVRSAGAKRRMAEIKNRYCPPEKAAFRADFLAEAPVVIVTCVDRRRAYDRGLESAVLATAHLLLAAAARGLGTVYLSAGRSDAPALADALRDLLQLPADMDPVTIVPLGYPGEVPEPKELRPLDKILFRETYGNR